MSSPGSPLSSRGGPAAASGAQELLASARSSVLAAWPREGTHPRGQVQEELRHLAEALRIRTETGSLPEPRDECDRLLARRLLDGLRIELLHLWRAHGTVDDPRFVLDLLVGLEELSRSLLPKDARDFASRLADPDGFELLVEVAHDLRSPLTSISFMAETLRSGHSGEINELQRSQLGLIYSAALGMTTVVSDIMELARMGTDPGEEPPRNFAISEVLDTVARTVQPMAEEKGVELRIAAPEHDRVVGHDVPLSRVLLNLVTNGLKFTEEGWVELGARHVAEDTVEFRVQDTGRGISPENQRILYEPFRKASDREGSFFSGSGLGLSIARRLVRSLGSELELETALGEGTRFSFRVELPPVTHY